jgi:hypothetical protein
MRGYVIWKNVIWKNTVTRQSTIAEMGGAKKAFARSIILCHPHAE